MDIFLNTPIVDLEQDQLNDSIAKTQVLAAVKVERVAVTMQSEASSITQEIVWVTHNFGFLGGSLGCAEGEKITRAFEYAVENNLPVCVQVRIIPLGAIDSYGANIHLGPNLSLVPIRRSSYAGGHFLPHADGEGETFLFKPFFKF